jgi:hypothetical protein
MLMRVGAIAAALIAVLHVLGLVGLISNHESIGTRNWLVVMYQMNSNPGSLPSDPMRILNLLDVAILVLVGLAFLGLWPVLIPAHRTWTGIAIALPFIGILLLVGTGHWGRTAVMASGLIVAVLMFVTRSGRWLAVIGLLANTLLLAGDLATAGVAAAVVATLLGIGYLLLLAWYLLLSVSLLKRGLPGPWIRSRAPRPPML